MSYKFLYGELRISICTDSVCLGVCAKKLSSISRKDQKKILPLAFKKKRKKEKNGRSKIKFNQISDFPIEYSWF